MYFCWRCLSCAMILVLETLHIGDFEIRDPRAEIWRIWNSRPLYFSTTIWQCHPGIARPPDKFNDFWVVLCSHRDIRFRSNIKGFESSDRFENHEIRSKSVKIISTVCLQIIKFTSHLRSKSQLTHMQDPLIEIIHGKNMVFRSQTTPKSIISYPNRSKS